MDKKEKLKQLKERMASDMRLPFREKATNLVFGEGNPKAKILFIGEGPGYWEDQKGRPFVGRAGTLLNQLLQSIKVLRGDVFITNVVCFRPPNNRDPLPKEIAAFRPYLDKIIEIIQPKIIVTLGRFSMAKFLPNVRISSIHGKPRIVNWGGRKITLMPMYHPAAALRNKGILDQTREDFLNLPEILEEADKLEVEQMELV